MLTSAGLVEINFIPFFAKVKDARIQGFDMGRVESFSGV
jgi:hypothetical protein